MCVHNELEDIVRMLNFDFGGPAKEWDYVSTMNFLREKDLVRFFAKFYRGKVEFCVFSRVEIEEYLSKMGDEAPHELKLLDAKDNETKSGYVGDKKSIIFPEDSRGGYGTSFLHELELLLISLREFFNKLSEGFIDIIELNKHFYDHSSFFEFKQTKNPLKPTISITRGENYSTLNRTIFDKYIYPRLFGGQMQELTKIRKCRNCSSYFLSKRLSATFCSDKCRGAFHHANS